MSESAHPTSYDQESLTTELADYLRAVLQANDWTYAGIEVDELHGEVWVHHIVPTDTAEELLEAASRYMEATSYKVATGIEYDTTVREYVSDHEDVQLHIENIDVLDEDEIDN